MDKFPYFVETRFRGNWRIVRKSDRMIMARSV